MVAAFVVVSTGLTVRAETRVTARSLIKCPDYSSVYYVGDDGNRYVFPNSNTYDTWYEDYSSVETVSCDDLGEFPIGGVITYQPGTRMIKLQSSPVVYAVSGEGTLRAIPDEDTAKMLYGDHWAQYVDDLPDSFWPGYTVEDPLALMEIPNGIRIHVSENNTYYQFIDVGFPLILPSEFEEDHASHLRFVITKSQSPYLYSRSEPAALNSVAVIDNYDYSLVGVAKSTSNTNDFPYVEIIE